MNRLFSRSMYVSILSLILLLPGLSTAMSTGSDGKTVTLTQRTFVDISKKALPAVVSIEVKKTVKRNILRHKGMDEKNFFGDKSRPDGFSPFLFPFYEKGEVEVPAAGSGVIVRSEGYIITNNHVIADAKEGNISIKLDDDTIIDGEDVKIIGQDSFTDLAVLKIKYKEDLPYMEFADSKNIEIGEWVLALGNPLELNGSVSQGIISAKHRKIGKALIEDLVQTTASINPGNSGGPLINLDGKIVGINTAIASNTGLWQGVGFAIPSNTVKNVSDSIIDSGKAKRGWLGISMSELNPNIRSYYDIEKEINGIVVTEVFKDSPAKKAGIKEYDLITAVEGKKIKNRVEMLQQIAGKAVGTKIRIELYRLDGKKFKEKEIHVSLGERPSEEDLEQERSGLKKDASEVFNNIGILFSKKDVNSEESGLIIEKIKPGSPADKAGLMKGDTLLEFNRIEINSEKNFAKFLKKADKKQDHLVMFKRRNEIMLSTIKIK
jgi:serine protease Do